MQNPGRCWLAGVDGLDLRPNWQVVRSVCALIGSS
uniref:Uncharacterized protein n=1 Tax=Anguilla anguilla TaxID=7936 RepID=A0A0E9VY34_ANGAN